MRAKHNVFKLIFAEWTEEAATSNERGAVACMALPQGDVPPAWHGGYGFSTTPVARRSSSPRSHRPSSPARSSPNSSAVGGSASSPAGYSGYRSKEGYTGHHQHRGTSNIRTSSDQNRSSEALRSMWRGEAQTPRSYSSSDAFRRSSSPTRTYAAPVGLPSPRRVPPPAHYEYVRGIEGYTGHRPRTASSDNLGSGRNHAFHSQPRVGYPGQLLDSAHRVKTLSHQRGFYVS